jgi:hypothetical protein
MVEIDQPAKQIGLRNFPRILLGEAAAQELAAREASSPPRDAVQQPRRERFPSPARAIATVKAALKAGLSVKRATIAGVEMEFGQQEAAKEPAPAPEEPPRVALFKTRLVSKQR